jgi:hypothetical protein
VTNINRVLAYDVKIENSVDADSDVDSTLNVGTNTSNYINSQSKNDVWQNITEENIGGAGGSEWLDVNANDTAHQSLITFYGTQPYLDAQDQPTNYLESSENNAQSGWYYFPSTTLTGIITVNMSIYCNNDDGAGNDKVDVMVDYTGSGAGLDVGDVGQHTAWQYDTIALGTHTVAEVNALRVWFDWVFSGGKDEVRIDHVRIGMCVSGGDQFNLIWEHQVQSVDIFKDMYNISVYAQSSNVSESFEIQMWNYTESGWSTVLTTKIGTTAQWYNQSFNRYYVDNSTQQVTWRYCGDNETCTDSDDQTTLSIDYAGISYWNFTVNIIETYIVLSGNYSQGLGWIAFDQSPIEINVSSGAIYNIQIKGIDGTNIPIASEYLRYNTVDNPSTGTNLSFSWVDLYTSQSAGEQQVFCYLWVAVPFGVADKTVFTFTLEIQIIKS